MSNERKNNLNAIELTDNDLDNIVGGGTSQEMMQQIMQMMMQMMQMMQKKKAS